MAEACTGSVAAEMDKRLRAALVPTRLEIVNDSARHRGHSGDDGSGESHFTVSVESPLLAGLGRVARQRAVYDALGELVRERIHALSIRATAPGE